MVAWEAVVSGTWEYARAKITLCTAKRSRFGVSPRFEPRKPMRSARVVSRVIRMMFGGDAACTVLVASNNAARVAAKVKNAARVRRVRGTMGK